MYSTDGSDSKPNHTGYFITSGTLRKGRVPKTYVELDVETGNSPEFYLHLWTEGMYDETLEESEHVGTLLFHVANNTPIYKYSVHVYGYVFCITYNTSVWQNLTCRSVCTSDCISFVTFESRSWIIDIIRSNLRVQSIAITIMFVAMPKLDCHWRVVKS